MRDVALVVLVVEVVVAEGSLESGASTVGSRSEDTRAEADDQARESIVEISSVQVSQSVYYQPRKEHRFLPERVHESMVLIQRILRAEQSSACRQRNRLPYPAVQAVKFSHLTHAIDRKREAVQRSQDQAMEIAPRESIVHGEA